MYIGGKATIQWYFAPCGDIPYFTLYTRTELFICMGWIERNSLVKWQEWILVNTEL